MVLKIALTCLVLAAPAFGVENAKKKTGTSIEELSGRFQCIKDGIMDLSIVRKEIMAHIESLQVQGKPYGCYRSKKGTKPSLYATCDAAIIRTIMTEDLKTSLTDKQRREWINYINSFAGEDGVYGPALRGHSDLHANGMVIGALGPLGGKQKYPVHLYNDFNTADKIGPWLEKIDWKNLWGGSHLFWGGMHCFSFSSQCTEQWRKKTFEWLDANLDEQTGWWRKEVPHSRPGIEGLGGGAHIWPIYQHHNHPFPYPKRVIDIILAMQGEKGSWLEPFSNYMNLDALYGLAHMKSQAPGYREKDIANAVTKYGKLVMEKYHHFISSNPNLHNVLSVVGTLGLLNRMEPETFRDSIKWTDIFSDICLYQTKAVEVVNADTILQTLRK
jgi:hypothetical protein